MGVAGAVGSGKTSLVSAIMGEVYLQQHDLSKYHCGQFYCKPSTTNIFPDEVATGQGGNQRISGSCLPTGVIL